jgi:hypothetical protein
MINVLLDVLLAASCLKRLQNIGGRHGDDSNSLSELVQQPQPRPASFICARFQRPQPGDERSSQHLFGSIPAASAADLFLLLLL